MQLHVIRANRLNKEQRNYLISVTRDARDKVTTCLK